MQKKKNVSIVLTLCLIASMLIALVACDKNDAEWLDLSHGSYPSSLQNLMNSERQQTINRGMADGATQEEKKQAVIALYEVANKSRIDTPTSLVVQESDAGISMGTVLMHAFNLRGGDKWFYQLATQVETGNSALNQIMSAFAGFLKVGYTLGDGKFYYFNKLGPQFECNCELTTFPYATYVIPADQHAFETSMTEEELTQELHCLVSRYEICNMNFCAEIIADDPEIIYNAEEHYYTVNFEIDMSADKALLEEWFALPKEDMAVGGQTLEHYNYYTATLEVWENGYARSYESHADREAGMGSGAPVDKFKYFWNVEEIMGLLHEDVRIDITEYEDEAFDDIDDYITYYSNPEFVPPSKALTIFEILGIVVGCIAFVIIVIVVSVEVAVRQGKLPRLAEKRATRKAKREAKKEARRQKNCTNQDIIIDDLDQQEPDSLVLDQEVPDSLNLDKQEPNQGIDE